MWYNMDIPLHFAYRSSVDEHLACFHLLATANNTAVNNGIQVSVRVSALNYFVYIPRSGIGGS